MGNQGSTDTPGDGSTSKAIDNEDNEDYEEKKMNNDVNVEIKKANLPKGKCKNKEAESLYNYQCNYQINKDGSITFYPSPHLSKNDVCTKILPQETFLTSQKFKNIKEKVKGLNELEAIHDFDVTVCKDYTTNISPFIKAAIKAFNQHYPFKISTNNILLLVLQAIAVHVDKNAEKLREKYVKHEGKTTLTVVRDSRYFVLREQRRNNDWNGVIKEFVDQIDKNTVKDTVELMESDFSDSTIIDKVSSKICVMDICKNYFEYEFICVPLCGFPQITLSGNKSDWVKLKEKVEKLLEIKVTKKFGKQWGESLLPLLDRFIAAFDGDIDCLFWNSMAKSGVTVTELSSSGGPMYQRDHWFSGWFNILFPFICSNQGEFKDNTFCRPYSMNDDYVKGGVKNAGDHGNDIKVYPIGLSSAPVKTKYIEAATEKEYNYKMKFVSGMIGYTQCDKTYQIEPVTGWMIAYDE